MIFQEPAVALSPLHRVGTQMVEMIRFHRRIDRAEAWREAEQWLQRVHLPDAAERMHAFPHHLSGGMLQRVMIAMALMLDPALIIADEPTTALDVTIQAQIFDLMREVRKPETSMLLVTHDMAVVWEMCTRVVVMYAAEIMEVGPVQAVLASPLHPYTEALLESVLSLTEKKETLRTIPGQVPSPSNYPKGCRFSDRCRYCFDRCRAEHPKLSDKGGRQVRCFLRE
jgi:oligopeptide/dipeptide ABC transporter ATP-binding protein